MLHPPNTLSAAPPLFTNFLPTPKGKFVLIRKHQVLWIIVDTQGLLWLSIIPVHSESREFIETDFLRQ